MPETQWMTLTETADMMKRLPEQVTQMCEDGKLEYYLEDGRYSVSRESIDLFMHPPFGQSAPANPDSNGTPRRMYGRAPHEIEPLPESAPDSEAVNGPDEADAADGLESGDNLGGSPGRDDELVETAEDVLATEDAQAEEDVQAVVDVQPAEDLAETEDLVQPQITGHADGDELQVEPVGDAVRKGENLPGENGGSEPSIQDEQQAEATMDPGEPDARVAEILADLRTAITRHAREHKVFCDEIAGLADALESTLSRDGDKTSELTREISSLLARYTRR